MTVTEMISMGLFTADITNGQRVRQRLAQLGSHLKPRGTPEHTQIIIIQLGSSYTVETTVHFLQLWQSHISAKLSYGT
jgi:hypothetical protein